MAHVPLVQRFYIKGLFIVTNCSRIKHSIIRINQGLVGGLHIGRHVGWGRRLGWGWRTGWSHGWWTPSTSNQKSQLLKHQKWTKRHVSKRSIHNNTEMFSLHGGRVVGALVDARGAEKQKQAVRNRRMRVNFKEPYRHVPHPTRRASCWSTKNEQRDM